MNNSVSEQTAATGKRPILRVTRVSKRYQLVDTPRERFVAALLGPFYRSTARTFEALRDINFEIFPGDAMAVLGRNGAGKSTLLQIVMGVLQPSDGQIDAPNRISGLLDLGSGFNPDFTGRQNLILSAAIMGLKKSELEEKLDDIISFADIGDYIDRPVKTYSSGMMLRLAFAVGTSVRPDLLLVDEAMAVGDVFFRQRCYARLQEMRDAGTAVLLVTHALSDATEFCNRGIVISQGQVAFDGSGKAASEFYLHHEQNTPTGRRETIESVNGSADRLSETEQDWTRLPEAVDCRNMPQLGDASSGLIQFALLSDINGRPRRVFLQGQRMRIQALFLSSCAIDQPVLGIGIRTDRNTLVHGKNSVNVASEKGQAISADGGLLKLTYDVDLALDAGEYTIDLGLAAIDPAIYASRNRLSQAELSSHVKLIRHAASALAFTVVHPATAQPATFSHYGVADLPNSFQVEVLAQ